MVDFAAARRAMVNSQVHTAGVTDRRLLAAMDQVPRERFVPAARRDLAYIDDLHILGSGRPARFLAPPAIFARLVQLADITEEDSVLDFGAATGYSTAVLASLGREVVGLEADADLAVAARDNLQSLGVANISIVHGEPDAIGDRSFDVVLIEGAVATVPEILLSSLRPGGRLVALVQGAGAGTATLYLALPSGLTAETHFNATLPLLYTATTEPVFMF